MKLLLRRHYISIRIGGRQISRPASAPVALSHSALDVKVGEKVEARYRGRSRYYPGKIRSINSDGTYDIDYDDGDKEKKVKTVHIRHRPLPGGYAVGEKVEAKWQRGSSYWPGKISSVNSDGTYDIDYDDGDKDTNVKTIHIRHRRR